jgi:hypothetical protein
MWDRALRRTRSRFYWKENVESIDLVLQGIEALFVPGNVVELRIPKVGAGYYDNPKTLAEDIQFFGTGKVIKLSRKHQIPGVYYTLNPCHPQLLGRAENKFIEWLKDTTGAKSILSRRWLLLDVDPVREVGISSTEAEKQDALGVMKNVVSYLKEKGWPDPLKADSGNGWHALYRIEMPNDQDSTNLVKATLKTLSDLFSTPQAKIDTSVYDPSRIVKAYGSIAAKGDNTETRPHRRSRILSKPGTKLQVVTADQLLALVADNAIVSQAQIRASEELASISSYNGNIEPARVDEFLTFHDVENKGMEEEADRYKWVLDHCPFNEDHRAKDAAVFLYKEKGNLGFHCFHESCGENTWKQFRSQVEAVSGKKYVFNDEIIQGRIIIGPKLSEDNVQLRADLAMLEMSPKFPLVALDGSWIGELANELTRGTAIPPSFTYNSLNCCVGALADGLIGYKNYLSLHTRFYHMLVAESRTGKTESSKRVQDAINPVFKKNGAMFIDGTLFGSGQFMVKALSDYSNKTVITTYDEMSGLFQRGKQTGSTLEGNFLQLFDHNSISQGTMSGGEANITGLKFGMFGNFTPESFRTSFQGRGSKGTGLMARITLSLEERRTLNDDWDIVAEDNVQDIVRKIDEKLVFLKEKFAADQHRFAPTETPEAKEARILFKKELNIVESGYANELEPMFLRDLLLRCIFADGEPVITRDMAERSVMWAEHQLQMRYRLWEEDAENPVNAMCLRITAALKKYKLVSEADLLRVCHVERDGTFETFNRALRAMKNAKQLYIESVNLRGNPVFGWNEAA